jgi:hypothetical protein
MRRRQHDCITTNEKITTKKRTAAKHPFCNSPLSTPVDELLLSFFPDFFADESGQAAAISGFAFESVAGTFGIREGNEFENFGDNSLFGFDIVEFVIHRFFSFVCCGFSITSLTVTD